MIEGLGTDIIRIDRIEKALEKWGDNFLNYVFTPKEIEYCGKQKLPYQHYAGRFAAKEAVYKALNYDGHVSWKDIEILKGEKGKPVCHFKKEGYSSEILVSISHCKDHAIATAVVQKK